MSDFRERCVSMRPAHAVAAAALAVGLFACGGAPETPTTPTTSGTHILAISGNTTLSPGASSHLTVTETVGTATGATTSTPTSVTWQTRDPGVATVSADGVLTGVSVGNTLVSATADGLLAQSSVTVQPPNGGNGNTITGCTTITTPGNYVLGQDVVGSATCVSFTGVSGIHLDCQGHSVSGLVLTNVNGGSLQGCTVTVRMTLSSVTSVTLSRFTVQNDLNIIQSSAVVVSDSTLMPTVNAVSISTSSGVQLLRDTIATTKAVYGVNISGGTNNQVLQSTLTGGYTVTGTGADDGVILINETGDTIQGNTISGFYDAAIEGVDVVSNTSIANNTGSNIGFTGIGSYWCTAWTNNTIQGNHISNAPSLVTIEYNTAISNCGSPFPPAVFIGNQFIGNVFRDRTTILNQSTTFVVSMPGTVSGNLLQGNDFGPYDGPSLFPLAGFIDGGGNVCGPMNPAISNFPCTGGSSMNRRRP